ncbi:MAG: choice-of-anchor E domain-containing protein [Caldilineaceae bacterium]
MHSSSPPCYWPRWPATYAETISHRDSIPESYLPIDDDLVVPKFDASLGILTGVEISATATLTGTFIYSNPLNRPIAIEGNVSGRCNWICPTQRSSTGEAILGIDEPLDALGSAEKRFVHDINVHGVYTAPAALDAFTGNGTVALPTLVWARWQASGINSNIDIQLRTMGAAAADVTYVYAIPQINLEKLTNGVDADTPNQSDVPQIAPGEQVIWTYLLQNTGTVAVPRDAVTLTDSDPGVTPVFDSSSDAGADGLLSPGETWRYTATAPALDMLDPAATADHDIVPGCDEDGAGIFGERNTYANIGTVVVPGNEDSDPSHYCNPADPAIDIEKSVNGVDADNPDAATVPQLNPGAQVTWVYIVTNTGNVPFTGNQVTVTDSDAAVTPIFDTASDDGDGVLSPGESWRYTATAPALNLNDAGATQNHTVVQGCNEDGTGAFGWRNTYKNIGTVTVPGAEDTDPAHYCNPATPGIDIEKHVNSADADNPHDVTVPQLNPGEQVTWVYIVRNTGNVPFRAAQVTVTDSDPTVTPVFDATSDDGDGVLSPGESWRYTATAPALDLNDGDATANHTVVQGCDRNGTYVFGTRNTYANIGTVVVPGSEDDDPAHYCNPPHPAIDIETATNGVDGDDANDPAIPHLPIDDAVNWTYVVRNDGNVTFTVDQVVVTDSHPNVTPVYDPNSDDGDGLLSPGESWIYTAVGTALDLDNPVATVNSTIVPGCSENGANPYGTRNTYENIGHVFVPGDEDADPTHYCNPANPAIDIETATNGVDGDDRNDPAIPQIETNDPVFWSYVVRNDGNVTFTVEQVVVTDSHAGVHPLYDPSSDDGDGLLTPGESWRYTAVGTSLDLDDPNATQGSTSVDGCTGVGSGEPRSTYENVGFVVVPGDDDSDPTHYCNPLATDTTVDVPAIDIEKYTNDANADNPSDADVPVLDPGSNVLWEYLVTNTGDVTFALNEVQVTDSDSRLSLQWQAASDNGDGLLSPGESWRYTARGLALSLTDPAAIVDVTVVDGCYGDGSSVRPTYNNVATVTVPGAGDTDASHYCNPPLPTAVTLHSFRAMAKDGGIVVEWTFSNPINSLGFHVFRSTTPAFKDAAKFTNRMIVTEGVAGANEMQTVSVNDRLVLENIDYYYWLVEYDANGTETRYGPVSANAALQGTQHMVFLPLAVRR